MADRKYHLETLAVREGIARSQFNEHSEAMYLTSSFVFDSAAQAAARFSGEEEGNVYSRFTNPTVNAFQQRLAALEGEAGEAAAGLDPDHRRPVVADDRIGIGHDLAGGEGLQAAFDAIEPVRLAAVALAGGDNASERRGMKRRQSALAEDRLDPARQCLHAEDRHVAHGTHPFCRCNSVYMMYSKSRHDFKQALHASGKF